MSYTLIHVLTLIAYPSHSGHLIVKMAPKAVTLKEESDLQAMLTRLALEQEDVDGDEAEDS